MLFALPFLDVIPGIMGRKDSLHHFIHYFDKLQRKEIKVSEKELKLSDYELKLLNSSLDQLSEEIHLIRSMLANEVIIRKLMYESGMSKEEVKKDLERLLKAFTALSETLKQIINLKERENKELAEEMKLNERIEEIEKIIQASQKILR